ncbi:hypothetical protein [Dubosiella newyorkensis]|jgi:hypothetical protein|uniref:Uncharacterized protein n=1 Tax=Dubosiella newyorkensis TaxID=1862672 RepID=A0A1U7NM41_9FIRM|nr:hypothetical protein [Dubosiella newyorkensis]MCI9041004.1 hypothetical protein [Dubosiella newyorkensis]OLU46198.1 hypothetical protein BO225_06880 [Dubosiella newyorkensis]
MTHEEIAAYVQPILNEAFEEIMDDVTQANRISVIAKIYHELYEIPEDRLQWLDDEEMKEMILTIYYALSRQRHALTTGVAKEVKKYVKASYKDWKLLEDMSSDED